MKRNMILTLAALILLSGCGKVKEAKAAVKSMAETLETVKESIPSEAESPSGKEVNLTEDSVKKYYRAAASLKSRYSDIEFESPAVAAVQMLASGKDLKAELAKEGIDFEEFSGTANAILKVMMEGAADAMAEQLIPQVEGAIKALEATDTSGYAAEQIEALKKSIEEQKQKLEEARIKLSSAEYKERKRQIEMINAVRSEAGF